MRNFKHIETKEIPTWRLKLLSGSLPKRFFSNNLTANFILACEMILTDCFETVDEIRNRFRID